MPPLAEVEAKFEALLDQRAIPAHARETMRALDASKKWAMVLTDREHQVRNAAPVDFGLCTVNMGGCGC